MAPDVVTPGLESDRRRAQAPTGASRRRSRLRPGSADLAGRPRAAARAAVGAAVLAVLLWRATSPEQWWSDPRTAAVTVGSLAGLLGVLALLLAVLLVARLPWLERAVGLGRLTRWHGRMAAAGTVLVVAHVGLVVVGHTGDDGRALLPAAWSTFWSMLLHWPDMLPAFAGLVLISLAAVTSWRVARRRMRYESWWLLHLYTYLAIGLSLLHELSSGAAFAEDTLARVVWVAAHTGVLIAVVWYRLAVPVFRSLRHDLRVERVEAHGDAISVVLVGRRLGRLPLVGGQFANFRFCRRGMWWQAHPYSFAGPPHRSRVRLTIAARGDYAQQVRDLAPGTRVAFEGPYGVFTASACEPGRRVLIVAGGVGVTPVCSLLVDLPAYTRPIVVYRVRRAEDALFAGDLRRLVAQRQGSLHVLVGNRHEHPMDPQRLQALVPDVAHRHVFACGSASLVAAVRRTAGQLGVPPSRFEAEEFAR